MQGTDPQQRIIHPSVINAKEEKWWDFAEFIGQAISLLLCLYY